MRCVVVLCLESNTVTHRRVSNSEALRKSGVHLWAPPVATSSFARYCNGCKRVIMGLSDAALECEVCGMHAHHGCHRSVGRTCKTLCVSHESTAPTSKRSRQGEDGVMGDTAPTVAPALQQHHHQWLVGNLEVQATCCVCDGACASRFGLKGLRCLWYVPWQMTMGGHNGTVVRVGG